MTAGQIDALVILIGKFTTVSQVVAAQEFVGRFHESDRKKALEACDKAMARVKGG